ncbi:uncharacterized protein LOC120214765 [Hibiscus syriacus]|uniref:uncharacterized protein LOC120214765 n=1 Tax=Hibiscus syriacus TaxID=106335 RepID=UPI0019241FE8|nr:uncharacterized protein LOC120214765 [Hibiscus syriacus]
MDAFDIKLQKRNAMSKQHQLCKVANLLRFVEVCILLVLISRFTTHLPVAFGEYFRGLSVLLVSPRFVFVVVFAFENRYYEEFIEKREKSNAVHRYETEMKSLSSVEEKRIVSLEVNSPKETKNIRRTKSENLRRKSHKQHCNQLRRLGSEKYVKQSDPEEEPVKSSCPEDGMSNEQFRNTVEAFIARQKKLLREEEYSVILRDLE